MGEIRRQRSERTFTRPAPRFLRASRSARVNKLKHTGGHAPAQAMSHVTTKPTSLLTHLRDRCESERPMQRQIPVKTTSSPEE